MMMWEGKSYTLHVVSVAREESQLNSVRYTVEIKCQERNLFLELNGTGRWMLQKKSGSMTFKQIPGAKHCCRDLR